MEFKPPASFFIDDEGKPDRVRRKNQHRALTSEAPTGRKAKKKAAKGKAGDPPATLERSAARERDQYRCLMGVEDSAGRLLACLEELKILDDTIVVLAGDNGFFHGEHGLHGKMEAYEQALRIPMMARYPRAIKAGQLNLNPRDKEELYDLKSDPQEMKNLAREGSNRALIADLKRMLIEEMKKTEDPAIPAVQATL